MMMMMIMMMMMMMMMMMHVMLRVVRAKCVRIDLLCRRRPNVIILNFV